MRTFKANLNPESLNKLARDLKAYCESLDRKTALFVEKLLDYGITVAEEHSEDVSGIFGTHKMGQFVGFEKKLESSTDGCYGLLIGTGKTIESEWYDKDGNEIHGTINSLMAIEFGTAAKFIGVSEMFGRTVPKGTRGHDNDLIWYIATELDDDGNPAGWKKATAITPTRPMLNAYEEMLDAIVKAAKEVFGE